MRIYGKPVRVYHKCGDKDRGCVTRTLEIYETKTLYKAVLWNSSFIHWKSEPNRPIHIWKWTKDSFNNKEDAYNAIVEQHGWNLADGTIYCWDCEEKKFVE